MISDTDASIDKNVEREAELVFKILDDIEKQLFMVWEKLSRLNLTTVFEVDKAVNIEKQSSNIISFLNQFKILPLIQSEIVMLDHSPFNFRMSDKDE